MAMDYLLARAHTDVTQRPLHIETIKVLYDFKESMAESIEAIKYHSIPHCFRLTFHHAKRKAIFQYKLFSSHHWLPLQADQELSEPLSVPDCPNVGGWSGFINQYHGDTRNLVHNLRPEFITAETLHQAEFLHESLEEVGIPPDRGYCSENRGVICQLKVLFLIIC
jgi:hypothetical protein